MINLQELKERMTPYGLPPDCRVGISNEHTSFEQLWIRLYPHGTQFLLNPASPRRRHWELKSGAFEVKLTETSLLSSVDEVAREIMRFFVGLAR